MTRHDPFRAQRETKLLESLEPIKPAFKPAEQAHIDAWRNSRIERDFLEVLGGIAPRLNPICQKDGS